MNTKPNRGSFKQSVQKVMVKCSFCPTTMTRWPSQAQARTPCCSIRCAGGISASRMGSKHPRFGKRLPPIPGSCARCGSDFLQSNNHRRVQRFCSKSCASFSQSPDSRAIAAERMKRTRQESNFNERARHRMKNGGALHALAGVKKMEPSYPQQILFGLVQRFYPEAESEYRIGNRRADIAIPSLRLDIEYDGAHWHRNPAKDAARDEELLALGWRTIRVRNEDLKALQQDPTLGDETHA